MKLNDAMMNCTLVKKMSWVVLKCVNYYKSTHFWKYEKHISNQFAQGRDKDLRVGDAVAVRGEETTDLYPLVLPHGSQWYRVFWGWLRKQQEKCCPSWFPLNRSPCLKTKRLNCSFFMCKWFSSAIFSWKSFSCYSPWSAFVLSNMVSGLSFVLLSLS